MSKDSEERRRDRARRKAAREASRLRAVEEAELQRLIDQQELGADIEEIARDNIDNTLGQRVRQLYIQNSAELLAGARLDTPFVVDQTIPEQGICFLAGRPASMKSWLAYDMAIAVARGRPWLNFTVKKSGTVLVLNYDNPQHELARRFLRLGLRKRDKIFFHSPATRLIGETFPSMLQLPGSLDHLLHPLLKFLQPDLIVVDSYRQSHTGDERSSQDMGRVMSCLRAMTAYAGCALVVIHHLRKKDRGKEEDDEEPLRGSTEIEASADAILIARGGHIDITKTRGWVPTADRADYVVRDQGDRTAVRSPGEFDLMLSALRNAENRQLALRTIGTQINMSQKDTALLMRAAVEKGYVKQLKTSGKDVYRLENDPYGDDEIEVETKEEEEDGIEIIDEE